MSIYSQPASEALESDHNQDLKSKWPHATWQNKESCPLEELKGTNNNVRGFHHLTSLFIYMRGDVVLQEGSWSGTSTKV